MGQSISSKMKYSHYEYISVPTEEPEAKEVVSYASTLSHFERDLVPLISKFLADVKKMPRHGHYTFFLLQDYPGYVEIYVNNRIACVPNSQTPTKKFVFTKEYKKDIPQVREHINQRVIRLLTDNSILESEKKPIPPKKQTGLRRRITKHKNCLK